MKWTIPSCPRSNEGQLVSMVASIVATIVVQRHPDRGSLDIFLLPEYKYSRGKESFEREIQTIVY